MNVYVFKAALLCEPCGVKARAELDPYDAPNDPADESSYDSGDYPKGPYPDGGGESDTPHHCEACGEFLENPLTPDGVLYLADQLRHHREQHLNQLVPGTAVARWAEFYADVLK